MLNTMPLCRYSVAQLLGQLWLSLSEMLQRSLILFSSNSVNVIYIFLSDCVVLEPHCKLNSEYVCFYKMQFLYH